MSRIRTIKPEFFTSEDIVGLSPLARVLYIALWCEADREGRLAWKPGTLKLRYLPGEQASFNDAAGELIDRGLLTLYGNGAYAHIPTFLIHQRPNPREAKSVLPPPPVDSVDKSCRDNPQLHAANLDLHAQGGREGKEGKGKEGREEPAPSALFVDKTKGKANTTNGAWWKTNEGVRAKGEELGIAPSRGEEWREYRDRLFQHINAAKAKYEDAA